MLCPPQTSIEMLFLDPRQFWNQPLPTYVQIKANSAYMTCNFVSAACIPWAEVTDCGITVTIGGKNRCDHIIHGWDSHQASRILFGASRRLHIHFGPFHFGYHHHRQYSAMLDPGRAITPYLVFDGTGGVTLSCPDRIRRSKDIKLSLKDARKFRGCKKDMKVINVLMGWDFV